ARGAGKRARPDVSGRARSAARRQLPPVRRRGAAHRSRVAGEGVAGRALACDGRPGVRARAGAARRSTRTRPARGPPRCGLGRLDRLPYVAPERRNGGAPTGPRDDIFAVGVLLHEMLTGQPPTMQAESLEEVRSLPPWLAELARRCLTPEPAERWPDAAAALEQVSRPNSETV